jgi:hypothetical protein
VGSGRASILERDFPSAPGAVLLGAPNEAVHRYSRVVQKMNPGPRVRSTFCIPKDCQPSVTGRAVGRYDSASPRAASEASAASHWQQVTTLQPLPTQRFQVF